MDPAGRGSAAKRALPLALAGALLTLVETAFAVASGWDHPVGYFLLCAVLTILYAFGVAVLCGAWAPLRAWAVAVWMASIFAIVGRARDGLVALVVFAALRRWTPLRRLDARSEAFVAAGAIAWVHLLGPSVAERLGPRIDEFAAASAGVALGLTAALLALTGVARALSSLGSPMRLGFLSIAIGVPVATAAWWSSAHPAQSSFPAGPVQASSSAPSIIVIVLDTVGVRHLSLYGYSRPTSSNLEAFLEANERSAVYPAAFSNAPWTAPAHASLLTGLVSSNHGAHFVEEAVPGAGSECGMSGCSFTLSAAATLPEKLRDAGYRTIAVFANPLLRQTEGLSRGFDVFYQPRFPIALRLLGEAGRAFLVPGVYAEVKRFYPDATRVNRAVEGHLDKCQSRACFLLINYLDAHAPYVPDSACRGRFGPPWSPFERPEKPWVGHTAEQLERLMARHDEEVCVLDRAVGELLEDLSERRILDRAWVILTADHGEAFGEHGATQHGSSVYNEQVHVPLIVLPPAGVRLRPTEDPVSLIDLTATIAEIGGVGPLGEGRSLLAEGRERRAPIEFFARAYSADAKGPLTAIPARAVVAGRHKLIELDGRSELYDLARDPHEERDRARDAPEVVERLSAALPPLKARAPRNGAPKLSVRDREALRALGYLAGPDS